MPLADAIFPQTDLIEMLIEAFMPWFMAFCFVLAIVLIVYAICLGLSRLRRHSPVEQLLRKRHA